MVSLEITDQMWVEKPKFKDGFFFPSDAPGLGGRYQESFVRSIQ